MSVLVDQADRNRFVTTQGKNISVIAPAGVGKTTSIVDRIVNLARSPGAVDILPRLIVVTYSVRAAQEMQLRTRTAIRNAKVSPQVQRAFQQTFFGTIHSYCVRLLDRFGHYLGLPTPVELLQDDTELWNRFLVRGLGKGTLDDANLRELFHFYPADKLYALGKQISPGLERKVGPMPVLDLKKLLDYRDDSLHPATKKSIVRAQESARQWSEAWAKGDRFRSLPKCPDSEKAAAFAEVWTKTFAPLHSWLRDASLAFGGSVANAYERFRLSEAVMTYDDQVRLALRALTKIPEVQSELAPERLSVLLDEAQDTDPLQFKVLLRVAGLGDELIQADDQTFCVVGDFQQAIYAPRSNPMFYQDVHKRVSAEPRGMICKLQVTFRCDKAIINFVNRVFPSVLNDKEGQCKFEKLMPRENAGLGQVVRWSCPEIPEQKAGEKINAGMRSQHEAQFVAQKIKDLGYAGLGATAWSQVAVLCPRKDWLLDLQRELVALDLPVQLHSSNEQQRERTPGTWLTALLWIAAHPEDSFEIAGVLREIFGVSDHDIATYTKGDGNRLRLNGSDATGEGPVEAALEILRVAFANADTLPLHRLIQQVLDKTDLRARMNSIPDLKLENADRELDDFLASLAGRCAVGVTLAELAEELRLGLAQSSPVEEEIQNKIQLTTSHKSKGLEWQTVIVPYVFRTIESKLPPYPRLVQDAKGEEMICRDKADFAGQVQALATARDRQQLQRLLYVTCTRAKQRLLLIDDETVYADQKRRSGVSAGELLGFLNGENRAPWKELPETISLNTEVPIPEGAPESAVASPPILSKTDLQKALKRAQTFPRRVTPHALAVHGPPEAEPEKRMAHEDDLRGSTASNPGILYGTWWHEFVETVPWQQSRAAWQQKFTDALAHSPQPERSTREWELFCRSELANWLAEPGRLIQVEIPFLWRAEEGSCVEGVMDLAVYTESESAWRVIDWKTNAIGPAGSDGLKEIYREQIQAYLRALREMLGMEVRGSLYLTQNGEWLQF